jgi:hypothetical protein
LQWAWLSNSNCTSPLRWQHQVRGKAYAWPVDWSWRDAGLYSLAAVAVLLGWLAADCLVTGVRDMRRGGTPFERKLGRLTALTGAGLLLLGGLLWWTYLALR